MYNLLLYKTFILRSLITMLEDEGIVINTAAALDIEKILANTDVEKIQHLSELKFLLSPLICRNKEEQATVYKIFEKLDTKIAEDYKEQFIASASPAITEKETKKIWVKISSPWYLKKVLLPAAIILAALVLFYLFRNTIFPPIPVPDKVKKINIIVSPQQVLVNDTVSFVAVIDSSLNKKNITVDWKLPDTAISNSLSVTNIFKHSSTVPVTAYLKDADAVIIDSANYSVPVLCEPPPSVVIDEADISANNSKLANGNKKQFAPLFTNAVAGEKGYTYKWYVNDSLYSKNRELIYAKAYNTIKLVVECRSLHCSTDSLVAQIESVPALNAKVSGDNNLKILTKSYNWNNILMSLLFVIMIPFVISFLVYRIILSVKNYIPQVKEKEPGTEGPYKIQFDDQQHIINTEEGIRKLADILRKRQVSDIYKLNLRKTIRSTVIAGGIPKLEFSPLSKPVNFLVFIDKEKPDSHLVKLFEYLTEKLRKYEVNIHVYEYFKEPLFLSNERLNQERIPLEKLAALYPNTLLFIFGDARYFLYPLKGTLKNWVTNKLNNWPVKILVTQYTTGDWDKKEKLLIESNFVVLPADLSSLPVIDKITSGQIDIAAQKKEIIESTYRSRFLNFQDFETLQNYFGGGPMLQWICSLAIYPTIDWNFTIATGKAIEDQLHKNGVHTELVNYTNLLKIGRVSWMQDGIINESLRANMLAYLDKDAQVLARKTLGSLLYLIDCKIGDDSIIKERFDIHKKLNQFLLDSYQHNNISKEDEAFIKRLLTTNRLDEGQDIYLDNGHNSLLSHPFRKEGEIGLSRYFNLKKYRQIVYSSIYALPALVSLMLISFNLLKNNSAYLNWLNAKPVSQVYVLNVKGDRPDKEIMLELYYTPGGDRWRTQNFRLANINETFRYDSITITDTNSYGQLRISAKDGQLITADSFKLNSTVYNISISEILKIPLKIYYKDASSLTLANTIAENLPSNFITNIQQRDLNDTAAVSIYYFSSGYSEDVPAVAAVINNLLSINIKPKQVDSLNFAEAQASVIIYINTFTQGCTPVPITALSQSLNEIWHGGTSNRLININLAQRLLYYSVNSTNSFGTYSIDDICITKNGAYKITTKTKEGYKLFFIRNVKPLSFELSVCQDFAQTKTELQNKDESYCDRFNTMTWYYEKDPNRIFLPVMSGSLATSEKQKLEKKSDSIKNPLFETTISEYQYPAFNTIRSDNRIYQYFKNSNIPLSAFTKYNNVKTDNPFQRGYLNVIIKRKPVINDPVINDPVKPDADKPDCRRTFYSIDETKKLSSPLIVCKFDLSKEGLKSIPKELSAFINLEFLDLGTITATQSEIDQLQNSLPKCRIIYKLYTPPLPPAEMDLGYIDFDKKKWQTNASTILMNRIGKALIDNKSASVTLGAQYTKGESQKKVEGYVNQIVNYFAKMGLSQKSGQINIKITEANMNQQQQQQSSESIHITGIGFPAGFNSSPKSAN